MKDKATPFDWSAWRNLIDSIAALPKGGKFELNNDVEHQYLRVQRFVVKRADGKWSYEICRAMIDLADQFQLDWRRAARLFAKLRRLSMKHDLWRIIEADERAGDALKDLEDIRHSLSRLAVFSERLLARDADPRARFARDLLGTALHSWADNLHSASKAGGQYEQWEKAKAHGFTDTAGYDSNMVLVMWLRCNVLISKIVNQQVRTQSEGKAIEPSSAQSLAGVELPKLYSQCTGKKFGFSTRKDGQLLNTGGPRFAAMCYPVMGMPKPALQTLRTHWQSPEARDARDA